MRADDSGIGLASAPIAAPAKPLAPAGEPVPVTLVAGEETITIRGTLVETCKGRVCRSAGRMPGAIWAGLGGADGVLLAGGAPHPGLYRARLDPLLAPDPVAPAPVAPELLASGEVLTLCPSEEGAWALVLRNAETLLVGASPATPALQSLTFGEALLAAARARPQPVAALRRLVANLRPDSAERAALGRLIAVDDRADARALAGVLLAEDPSGNAAAFMYLLAHDAADSVRHATLEAVRAVLHRIPAAMAVGRLLLFVDDSEQDIAWGARDLLLERAPGLAFAGAPSAYKLDALGILAAVRERAGADAVREPLRILAADEDAEVRSAARLVQEGGQP